jgi:hypothetical protein
MRSIQDFSRPIASPFQEVDVDAETPNRANEACAAARG